MYYYASVVKDHSTVAVVKSCYRCNDYVQEFMAKWSGTTDIDAILTNFRVWMWQEHAEEAAIWWNRR
nr:MAG TPA: hypothetical protein [Caudoviricetes sp.]